jgi:hypothetical protein
MESSATRWIAVDGDVIFGTQIWVDVTRDPLETGTIVPGVANMSMPVEKTIEVEINPSADPFELVNRFRDGVGEQVLLDVPHDRGLQYTIEPSGVHATPDTFMIDGRVALVERPEWAVVNGKSCVPPDDYTIVDDERSATPEPDQVPDDTFECASCGTRDQFDSTMAVAEFPCRGTCNGLTLHERVR